jgi:hypothetical protein
MKRSLWYISCCLTLSLVSTAAAQASPHKASSKNHVKMGKGSNLGRLTSTDRQPTQIITGIDRSFAQAPAPPAPPAPSSLPPSPTNPIIQENRELQNQLNNVKENPAPPQEDKFNTYQPKSSPSFSIFNPVGFGADKNLVFFALSYQNRTRTFGDAKASADGEAGIGVGLGDALNSVGVELSYSLNSFGSSAGFGSGGFNAKVHKRLGEDAAVAIGWNQFAQIQFGGGRNGSGPSDYPANTYYAVGTKIFRTRDDINEPFSRVAVTGGLGSGAFLPFDRNADPRVARGGLNPFGSVGVRIARPVSAVLEWTGQDLGAGVSIAPFDNFPLVITPAFRDIAGAGDGKGARFILGASVAFNF